MNTKIMLISSSEIMIESIESVLKSIDISDIQTYYNKEDAINAIQAYMDTSIIILDQDLKDSVDKELIKEFNGEDIAIKLMRDGIEIPTILIGTHCIEYEDDNTIAKINVADENIEDSLLKTLRTIGVIDSGQAIDC